MTEDRSGQLGPRMIDECRTLTLCHKTPSNQSARVSRTPTVFWIGIDLRSTGNLFLEIFWTLLVEESTFFVLDTPVSPAKNRNSRNYGFETRQMYLMGYEWEVQSKFIAE